MGIIEKQAIKGNVYTYFGVVLGFVTTSLIFPRYLTTEQIGLLNILIANTLIFAQFGTLGIANITTRMFPYFRDKNKGHNGFLFLASAITLAGYLLVLIAFFILKPTLLGKGDSDSILLLKYFHYIPLLILFKIVFTTLDNYYKVLYNAVKGTLLKEFVQRLLIIIALLVFMFDLIDFHTLVLAYIVAHCLPTLIILISVYRIGELKLKPDFKFLTKELSGSIASVGIWGIVSSAAGIITINIDRLMLNDMLDLNSVGIYTTTFFFGTLVSIPSRPLTKISSVVIADSWKRNDLDNIQKIYTKSSLNQYIVGVLILMGVWVNIDNVFEILPQEYLPGKYVILFIGLAYLTDMISGNNSSIIVNSKYYRTQSYFMIGFVLLVVITNLLFIPKYAIIGAAIASFFSKLIFNIVKIVFLWVKYRFMPFNIRFLYVTLIILAAYFVAYIIPRFDHFVIDIVVRSAVMTLIFGGGILAFSISEDISGLIHRYLKKVLSLLGRK